MLRMVEKGRVQTDEINRRDNGAVGDVVGELENRLLVDKRDIHTAKGFHAKVVRSWANFAD